MSAPRSVYWAPVLRLRLVAWARAARTREACGVLLGTRELDAVEIRCAVEARNLSADADAFVCDPGAIVAAEQKARATGLTLVGFWHSHGSGPALPSSRDAAGAWPVSVTAVVTVLPRPSVRVWRFEGRAAVELPCTELATCVGPIAAHNQPWTQSRMTASP
ncbi:MAG: Mov34/MPN/PAD-1 family protein [Planctomycetes bacterium]|nr:Mov34/MPN/PAD-1 family protein [Planctomycetota bacterium]